MVTAVGPLVSRRGKRKMSSIMHASRFLLGEAARGDGGKGRANVEVSQKYAKSLPLKLSSKRCVPYTPP